MKHKKRVILLKLLALSLFLRDRPSLPFVSNDADFDYFEKHKHISIDASSNTMLTDEVNDNYYAIDSKYLIESSRQLKEIRFACERKDLKKMISLTENYAEFGDFDLIEELREGWDYIGREHLPLNLYEKLYSTDINIEIE